MDLNIIHIEHLILGNLEYLFQECIDLKSSVVHKSKAFKEAVRKSNKMETTPCKKIMFGLQKNDQAKTPPTTFMFVKSLNPYQPRWNIKARVTSKKKDAPFSKA